MIEKDNKMPGIETLRKYHPGCSMSDQELLETAEWVRVYSEKAHISPDNKILTGIIAFTEPRNEKAQVRLVEDWNRAFKPGENVIVTLDDGSKKKTRTTSEAFMLGACREYPGHTAVIGLEGISRCYRLDRVCVDQTITGEKPC